MREEQAAASWGVGMDLRVPMCPLVLIPAQDATSAHGAMHLGLACWSTRWAMCFATLDQNLSITRRAWENLIRIKGKGHCVTSERRSRAETESRKWRSAGVGWAHAANSPVVVGERKCAGVQIWSQSPGRLSCTVFFRALVQQQPTSESSQGLGLPLWMRLKKPAAPRALDFSRTGQRGKKLVCFS